MKKMNKSAYIVELCGSRWSPWWWRLRARNGKILAHSEDYTTKRARDKTALRLAKELGAEVRRWSPWPSWWNCVGG